MVVFTCNACGEAVKKGQVEKHVNICRHCQCLSCMDCGKDFWGDDYKCHVKCISEDQKYGGKGYEAKAHKGDAKQQEWIQRIHETIKKTNMNPKVREILEQMYAYDNIPRKKKKFQNWMANSLKIHSTPLQDQVWDIFSEATRKEVVENSSANNEVVPTPSEVKTEKCTKKKSKKEERENIKKNEQSSLHIEQESKELIKSKKSKRDVVEGVHKKKSKTNYLKMTKQQEAVISSDMEMNGNSPDIKEPGAKGKTKKRKRSQSEDVDGLPTTEKKAKNSQPEENEDEHQGKFRWKETIKAVLKQAPDHEISVKKLRKKVLAQYYAVAADHYKSEKEILALFNKKVSNNPKFRVLKEKVKLIK
ncbi:cell growth-regulating nucleolar protein isoform X2 [Sceloporus undulatus]|uniref:cell growth-regulating nucleolar protein isoform X2 n=1 Tax=Sceloporus undulatus TaxID=8520 RepID=UPI001C4CD6B1|nr:cell growth-regulating nucleolar protein isoform X2 [Sceloporus undulatus]